MYRYTCSYTVVSSIEETTAGQKKGAGLGLAGTTIRRIQGVRWGTIGHAVLPTGARRKASRFVAGTGKVQRRNAANKRTQGGRLTV